MFPKIQNGCSAGARYSENKFIASRLQALVKSGVMDERVAEKFPIIFDKAIQHTIVHPQEEPGAFLAHYFKVIQLEVVFLPNEFSRIFFARACLLAYLLGVALNKKKI
jgi:hypothetical protein